MNGGSDRGGCSLKRMFVVGPHRCIGRGAHSGLRRLCLFVSSLFLVDLGILLNPGTSQSVLSAVWDG